MCGSIYIIKTEGSKIVNDFTRSLLFEYDKDTDLGNAEVEII